MTELQPGYRRAGAAVIGGLEPGGAVTEQVGLFAGQREQAILGRGMRLERAVDQDMAGRKSALGEGASNQQAAVTIERLALGAHQAQAVPAGFVDGAVETGAKRRRCRHRVVVGDAVAIEGGIARPAAQRVAERQVGDAAGLEAFGQRPAGEPGESARERHRAHIGDRGDAGAFQQIKEAVGRQVGMADG
jgi:hypothetical protein